MTFLVINYKLQPHFRTPFYGALSHNLLYQPGNGRAANPRYSQSLLVLPVGVLPPNSGFNDVESNATSNI